MKKVLFTILSFLLFTCSISALNTSVPVEFESKDTCHKVFGAIIDSMVNQPLTQQVSSTENRIVNEIPLNGVNSFRNFCDETKPYISFINQGFIDSITTLNLFGETPISDLRGIENFTNLTELNLKNNEVVDLTPLMNLSKLTNLNLAENIIKDVKPLADLTSLTVLYIQDNYIEDISSLKKLTKLVDLRVAYNYIYDISVLENFTDLESFYAGDNYIKNIIPLKNLVKLKTLRLGDNYIYDISSLSSLVNLIDLRLGYNYLKDISVLKKFDKLESLCLEGNLIEDFSALEDYADEDDYISITTDLYLEYQEYEIYAAPGEKINLPKIFVDLKTPTSFLYDELVEIDYDTDIFEKEENQNSSLKIKNTVVSGNTYSVVIDDGVFDQTVLYVHIIEEGKKNFTNEEGNVQVLSDITLGSNLVLIVEDHTKEIDEEVLEELKKQDTSRTFLKAFEFFFVDGDNRVSAPQNSKYTVKIKLTEDLKNYDNFKIGYINPDTDEIDEWLEGRIEGDYLVFDVLHFSQYLVYGSIHNPKTGDNIGIYFIVMLMSIASILVTTNKLNYKKTL